MKIIDFGIAKIFKPNQKLKSIAGTVYYIAPEVLQKEYDHKCDIWSIGVMTYVMISGRPPFDGGSDGEIFNKIQKGKFTFPEED